MSDDQGNRLFVGNLSWSTTDESLFNAFQEAGGSVIDAKVIIDRYSHRSRGFGFVTLGSAQDASDVMNKMNGQELDGRQIRVDYASSQRR